MTDQNYWNSPSNGSQGPENPETPIAGSTQPTQAFRSGTTDAMPAVDQSAVGQPKYAYENQSAQQSYQYRKSAPKEKKSGSGAKTFLFGFLGALLACALAFGGFAAWQTTQPSRTVANNASQNDSTAATTDQSVINAIDEGKTLAEAVAAKALPSVAYLGIYTTQSNMYSMYAFGMGKNQANEHTEWAL